MLVAGNKTGLSWFGRNFSDSSKGKVIGLSVLPA